ncbi:MAG TPA: plastocyanin/azurin family copper-binding protein [Actinomycetota bacterium]|nr:plastocyanin/azurin family copper-binding protein [Actinomycetota bacterium]
MVRKLMLGLCLAAATFAVPSTALAKGQGSKTAPAQAAAANTVDATEQGSNLVFTPDTITVTQGGTVTFKDTGQAAHTATADNGSFDSGNLNAGDSYTTPPLTTVGTISYKCTYHASLGMVGTINVVAGGPGAKVPTVTASVSPTPSPSFFGSGLPSPQTAPTPPPSQKYFPKVGGALLVLLVLGLGLGYVKLKNKLNDKS